MIGQTISHYKIIEKLGEGGMGVVYKAEDITLKRIVALKFLPKGLEAHEPEKARFMQEAQAASALNHPNICAIHAFGEHDAQQFIDMEYVDGITLRQKIQAGQWSISDAAMYAIQIGEALQEAHHNGIVHRDVKPENIMVNSKNQIKVMDFGLAKLKGSLKLTKTSSTVGTLAYMAPEQIQGEDVDARSDIFSFGIVLYEMLTGHLPFRGEHEAAMMYSIMNEEPAPLQKYLPGISSELVHILNRALEKDSEERYQSVHDMVIDLKRSKKETGRVSREPQADTPMSGIMETKSTAGDIKRVRKGVWFGVEGLAVVIITALFLFLLKTPSVRLNPNRTTTILKTPFKEIGYASVSRDGNWVVFPAADENGKWDVYWMNVATEKVTKITNESAIYIQCVEISPDLSRIAYDELNQIGILSVRLVSSQGGESRTLVDKGSEPKWSPDGQRIGFNLLGASAPSLSGRFEFWSIRPDGTDIRRELIDTVSEPRSPAAACWSTDGKSITWVRNYSGGKEYSGGYGEVMVRELATGKERQITSDRKAVDEVFWASNDEILYVSNKSGITNVWTVPARGGPSAQITEGSVGILGARISADNTTLVYIQQENISHIWTSAVNGGNGRQVTFEDEQIVDIPVFAPDGRHISYSSAGVDAFFRDSHLYVMDRDRKNQRQLTSGPEITGRSVWSPDGKWLAYSSRERGEPDDSSKVYLIQPFNPSPARLLCNGWPHWWCDSDNVVVWSQMKTWLYPTHGGTPTQVYEDSTIAFPIRGTNQWIIKDLRNGRGEGRWIVSLDSRGKRIGIPRMIPLPVNSYANAPAGGQFLIYIKQQDELWRVWTSTGKEELIGKALAGMAQAGLKDISWDGKELLWVKEDNRSKLVLVKNVFE